ncbi:Cathelicidin-B1 [Liparis tanakae]|uniref:Cathelicidin-B1 n=1 Tax=Liparis tanakae TaxID=230148 RepID=A0A4Z2FIY2_9TELE|nr:Cathelicidin-B1 [Liparis tanakae]
MALGAAGHRAPERIRRRTRAASSSTAAARPREVGCMEMNGSRDAHKAPGLQVSRAPGLQGSRAPGLQGSRAPGLQGFRAPGLQGSSLDNSSLLGVLGPGHNKSKGFI